MKIKAIYSVIIYALLGTSCRSDDKQSQNKTGDIFETQVTIESKPAREPIDEVGMSGEAKEALNAFKSLYVELLAFKDSEDFKKYGFMIGGPYNNWLKRVSKLKETKPLST